MYPSARQAIRAQLIAAMQQRADGLDGEARRALDVRLAELRVLDADAHDEAPKANGTSPQPSPLRGLVDQLAREATPEHNAYPDLPALADFRQLWSTLRADSQLQQSVAQTPTDAGPLNSAALASRSVALMRELSSGYLRFFLAYVDDLAWLEQLNQGAALGSSTATAKARSRKKSRGG
jgi:hypothetical protein